MNTNIIFFDFHCHVDLHKNPPSLISFSERTNLFILAITTLPRAWSQNYEWTKNSKNVYCSLGLHPELIGEYFQEKKILEDYLPKTYLIGETGLDGSPKYKATFDNQKDIFKNILIGTNKLGNHIISIHSRNASKEVLEMIEKYRTNNNSFCILHWFLGTPAEVAWANKLGCYFSVNKSMFSSKRGLSVLNSIPIDRLLTETDAPFTTNGKEENIISDINEVITKLADLHKLTTVEMNDQLYKNATFVLSHVGIKI
jgi:TatD DNase family protein